MLRAPATPARSGATSRLADDVRFYLSQDPRQLPSKYLYDALGSALFDAITCLPWYRPTRAEARLIQRHAAEIYERAERPSTLLELGPGNGDKLLAFISRGVPPRPLDLRLIDVSPASLARAAQALSVRPRTTVASIEATYDEGLARFARERTGPTLVLFLGSNIGNFDPPAAEALVRQLRAALRTGDGLLLGTDLVKPEEDLLRAYDDPLGVTAAFNRNLLVRLNRELDATFDLGAFGHRALWNRDASRVEMHLVSRRAQHVCVPGAQLEFDMAPGETIWTESSYKYQPARAASLLRRCGFEPRTQWIDDDDRFALTLACAA